MRHFCFILCLQWHTKTRLSTIERVYVLIHKSCGASGLIQQGWSSPHNFSDFSVFVSVSGSWFSATSGLLECLSWKKSHNFRQCTCKKLPLISSSQSLLTCNDLVIVMAFFLLDYRLGALFFGNAKFPVLELPVNISWTLFSGMVLSSPFDYWMCTFQCKMPLHTKP